MAKGVEDTAFYVYNRLVSLNEVGGDPDRFGMPPGALHRYNQDRQAHWPYALSPRPRTTPSAARTCAPALNVLSEMPEEWRERLGALERAERAAPHARSRTAAVPDANEEYLLYQTLLGAWPLEPCSAEEYAAFVERIQAYMVKALHEAKVHTSWINPNAAYDDAVQRVRRPHPRRAAQPRRSSTTSARFQRRISHYGLFNSLAQTLLKLAAPGRAGHLPGDRAVGLQPGGSGQPPAGRLRRGAAPAARAARAAAAATVWRAAPGS